MAVRITRDMKTALHICAPTIPHNNVSLVVQEALGSTDETLVFGSVLIVFFFFFRFDCYIVVVSDAQVSVVRTSRTRVFGRVFFRIR